jgi:hypothetical protein
VMEEWRKGRRALGSGGGEGMDGWGFFYGE